MGCDTAMHWLLKRIFLAIGILMALSIQDPLMIAAQPLPQPIHSSNPHAKLFDSTIIVKYKEGRLQTRDPIERRAKMNDIVAGFATIPELSALTAFRTMPILGVQRLRLGAGQKLNEVIVALRTNPAIQHADYNFLAVAQGPLPKEPDDPFWKDGFLWGLEKINQPVQSQP